MEKLIDSIEVRTDLAKVILKSVPDQPGMAGDIFTRLGEMGYNVEAISSTGAGRDRCDVTFAVAAKDADLILQYLRLRLGKWDAKGVLIDRNLAVILLFGQKLATTPGIAGKVFGLLGKEKINIEVITTGLMSLALMIPKDQADAAVAAIKQGFGLS